MRNKISSAHARAFTRHLDRMANLLQKEANTFGIPNDMSRDLAYRMDYVADLVTKNANLLSDRSPKNPGSIDQPGRGGFDGADIGEINSGPSTHLDRNETWMNDQFTQQENAELRTRVERNMLENTTEMDRMASRRHRAAWEKRRAHLLKQAEQNMLAGEEEEEEEAPPTSKEARLRQRERNLEAREQDLANRIAAFRRKTKFKS